MQPIPKELQGTKAIPFMEWCIKNAVLTLVTQNGQIRENYFEIPEYFLNFFNQPFTPEMLQGYFENWSEWTGRIDVQVNKFSNLLIIGRYEILDDSEIDIIKFYTLNDLITLCTLAGVNLTWKGEK